MTARIDSLPPKQRLSPGSRPESNDDEIYQKLLLAIVEHQIMPGTRLPEQELAETFGVNRPRVRSVLQRLAQESVVTIRRNRGATVAQLSGKEARDVFAARRILEAGAAALVASRITVRKIRLLRRLVEEEREALKAGDRRRSIMLSGEFHRRLVRELDNPRLNDFLHELVAQTSLIIAVYGGANQSSCRCQDHAELLDLLTKRDGEAAAASMSRHLESIEANLQLDITSEVRPSLRDLVLGRGTQ